MGGPGFVLSCYFNKFACKVSYLMVTQKVIALVCLTEPRLFFAVKVLSALSQAILWLTKAHQLLLVWLLTHITLRPGLFSFNFFSEIFLLVIWVYKKIITFKVTTFEIKKDQWVCLACLSVLCFKSIEKTIWDTSGVCEYIRSYGVCPLRQGWYQLKILLEEVLNHLLLLFLLANIFSLRSLGPSSLL